MLKPEALFVCTLEDLVARLRAGDGPRCARRTYNLLRAAHLLRQLLLDRSRPQRKQRRGKPTLVVAPQAGPLAEEIGRLHPLVPIVFRAAIATGQGGMPCGPDVRVRLLPVAHEPLRDFSLHAFLAEPVLEYEGPVHTVADVIKHAAHVQGGVHRFPEEDTDQVNLSSAHRRMSVGNYRVTESLLRSIADVVIEGLEPLRAAANTNVHWGNYEPEAWGTGLAGVVAAKISADRPDQ